MFIASTNIYKKFTRRRSNNIAKALHPLLSDHSTVLDFGCGNFFLGEHLNQLNPTLHITGIDIVEDQNLNWVALSKNPKLSFVKYSTKEIPFEDHSFDIALASASLHHCDHPEYCVSELKRVVKNSGEIILVEEMYLHALDKIWISAQDWIFNSMKKGVPIPLQYRSYGHYIQEFKRQSLEILYESYIRPIFPYVHHYIFKLKVSK